MSKFPDITQIRPKYSNSEISKFNSEDEFMVAYVELLKQTITILHILIEEYFFNENKQPLEMDREPAIIAGNFSRLIKLNTSLVQNVCEKKLEICYILSRCLAETSINLQYMLMDGEENVLRNYVKYSLITEKGLWNTIKENIKKRGGSVLAIEERMQKSIEATFNKSDFELDEIKRSSKWKSIAKRAEKVAGEMFYNVFYGISSHSVHGNWQDIYFNNLNRLSKDEFSINLQWSKPKPQIMDSAIIFNLIIVKTYAEKESFPNLKELVKTVKILGSYHTDLQRNHEKIL